MARSAYRCGAPSIRRASWIVYSRTSSRTPWSEPLLPGAWLAMVVGVTLLALLLDLADTGYGEVSLVLLLAPVLPVLGVAASWSRGLDPAYELTASVPRAVKKSPAFSMPLTIM